MLKFPGINPVDYLIIGHITRDRMPTGHQLGGSVSYAGLTAHALGKRVGMVTSWGEEDDPGAFEGIAIANNLSDHSTTFENIYTPEGRQQHLHHLAHELAYYHIPESWRQARIVHLAPVAQEVQPNIVRHFPEAYIFLTPQGWLRKWDVQGLVSPTEWPEAAYILQQTHAVVLSEEDLSGDQRIIDQFAAAAPILVVTRGAQGASVYTEGKEHHLPAPQVEEIDPTGAGDIFAAAFFTHLTQNSDPLAAAEFAIRIASDSVTRPGLAGVPTEDIVYKISSEV
jgi:sugar/nucleoside kinase (ribokinase family)